MTTVEGASGVESDGPLSRESIKEMIQDAILTAVPTIMQQAKAEVRKNPFEAEMSENFPDQKSILVTMLKPSKRMLKSNE